MENIEIRLIHPSDKESLIDFLQYHSPRNGTPVWMSLDFSPDDVEYMARRKAHLALMQPDKAVSYLATDNSTGAIIGVTISYIVDPSDQSDIAEFESTIPISPKLQQYKDFHRLTESGLREFFPPGDTSPYLMGDLNLVDPKYQNLGIVRKMEPMSRERAWSQFGCKYAITHCSSYKSIRWCEKCGFVTLRWIRFEDYYNNGKRVFNFEPDSKDVYAKLMMCDIEKSIKAQ